MLKRETYEDFINQYIQDSRAEVLDRNPTEGLAMKVNRLLKHPNLTTFIDKNKIIDLECPRIFAFVKMHKEPPTARPIVEKMRSPTFNIEKQLAKWCNGILGDYLYNVNSL